MDFAAHTLPCRPSTTCCTSGTATDGSGGTATRSSELLPGWGCGRACHWPFCSLLGRAGGVYCTCRRQPAGTDRPVCLRWAPKLLLLARTLSTACKLYSGLKGPLHSAQLISLQDSNLLPCCMALPLSRALPTHPLPSLPTRSPHRPPAHLTAHPLISPPTHPPARSMRLSNVLENGNGSPGSLTVLYLELAARLSLPLQPVALEGGRYYVLQPADESVNLSAAGELGWVTRCRRAQLTWRLSDGWVGWAETLQAVAAGGADKSSLPSWLQPKPSRFCCCRRALCDRPLQRGHAAHGSRGSCGRWLWRLAGLLGSWLGDGAAALLPASLLPVVHASISCWLLFMQASHPNYNQPTFPVPSPRQVKELFEVEGELKPCSNEVMLAGMLGVLRDSHWCAACAVVTAAAKQAGGPLQLLH